MRLDGIAAVVTGGASGLGRATAELFAEHGAKVVVADLSDPGSGSDAVRFVASDVTDPDGLDEVFDTALGWGLPVRAVVHCAGRGGDRLRVLTRDGRPGDLAAFAEMQRVNLVGTYNVLRVAASRMCHNEIVDGDRGALVLTASVAAFDGQIGQTSYAAAKAGIHGLTLPAARDLASWNIRVNTIAPGVFDTPMLARLRPDLREGLERSVPHPSRLGSPDDFARLAVAVVENGYLNGTTIRLDGAVRMAPR